VSDALAHVNPGHPFDTRGTLRDATACAGGGKD
jgi:hypothetical protein